MPPGFAHGFHVLSHSADFQYKCTDTYAPEYERCIRWNDEALAIGWPLLPGGEPIISHKDAQGMTFPDARVELENRVTT